MPYSRAWIGLLVLTLLTLPAFWPVYLSALSQADWQVHFHGTTAGLWMVLLIWQSWSIHHGRRSAHRSAGLAGLVLMPFFLAGGVLVVSTFAGRENPFADMFAARLALVDSIFVIFIAACLYLALRHRRNVGLHGGWMLATAFPLIMPVLARLTPGFVPGLTIRSPEDLPRFAASVHLATGVAIALALYLYFRYPRHRQPFLATVVMLVVTGVAFEWLGKMAWWVGMHQWVGAISPAVLLLVGLLVGTAIVYLGWNAGKRATPP